jgi:hypothetical protein
MPNLSLDYTIQELQNSLEDQFKLISSDLLLFNDSGTQLEANMSLESVLIDLEKIEIFHTSRGATDPQKHQIKSSRADLRLTP